MKVLSLLTLVSTFLLVSCSSTMNRSQSAGELDVRVHSNLAADLDVDMTKKISGSAKHTKLFGLIDIKTSKHFADGVNYGVEKKGGLSFFGPSIVDEAKSAAAYRAVVPNRADVLVAPQYLIKVESYFFGAWKEVTAQVTGYAGKIRNIKTKAPTQ